MKRNGRMRWRTIFFALLLAALFSGCAEEKLDAEVVSNKPKRLRVCASFYLMEDFAVKIGSDAVEVFTLMPSGGELHEWEPGPRDIAQLENADVFLYNGAELEHWVKKTLDSLENTDLIVIETSKGIPLLEGTHHEDEADGRDDYDPHVWLNPLYARQQMKNILDGFIKADPARKDAYQKNFDMYDERLVALDQQYRGTLANLKQKDLVVEHQAYGYLCAAYGLNQIPIEGVFSEGDPDPATMAGIVDQMRERQIGVVFFEETSQGKVAQSIADAAGAEIRILHTLESVDSSQIKDGKDYFRLMEENLETLSGVLK